MGRGHGKLNCIPYFGIEDNMFLVSMCIHRVQEAESPEKHQGLQEPHLAYKSQSSALKAVSCVLTPYLKIR
jgi:hypothetical protein